MHICTEVSCARTACMTNSSLCQYSNNLSFITTDYPACFFFPCMSSVNRKEVKLVQKILSPKM